MPWRTSGSEHLVKLFVCIVDLTPSFLVLIGGMLGMPWHVPGSEHMLLRQRRSTSRRTRSGHQTMMTILIGPLYVSTAGSGLFERVVDELRRLS